MQICCVGNWCSGVSWARVWPGEGTINSINLGIILSRPWRLHWPWQWELVQWLYGLVGVQFINVLIYVQPINVFVGVQSVATWFGVQFNNVLFRVQIINVLVYVQPFNVLVGVQLVATWFGVQLNDVSVCVQFTLNECYVLVDAQIMTQRPPLRLWEPKLLKGAKGFKQRLTHGFEGSLSAQAGFLSAQNFRALS